MEEDGLPAGWLRSQVEVVRGPADRFFLLAGGVEKPEAVLKAMTVPHFSLELQRFRNIGQVQLQFHCFAHVNIARNRGAQAAFSNVFASAMQQGFVCPDDQPLVQKIARMRSRLRPRVWFVFSHDLKSYHNVSTTGLTVELLFIKFPDRPLRMLGDDRIRFGGHAL